MSSEEPLVIPETLLVQLGNGQVEEMPLDAYIKGVVPPEMGLKKPIEALKAQAIAARSYAISTRRHASQGFDVCTTTHCQVYKPAKRYADSDRAVDETAGLVITYKDRIVGTPFFAHCDGYTRNSEQVWSSEVSFLRSVPCICGYTELYGHGAGMCQRGAAEMARQDSSAIEILEHYYTNAKVAQAIPIPRTSFHRSIILGLVVDGQGKPLGGTPLVLSGVEGRYVRRTNGQGKFWVSGLPAGAWQLDIRDRKLRFQNLVTDGRNTLELRFMAPDLPPLTASTMPLAYPRHLAGTLGFEGVQVVVSDPAGNEQKLFSGSVEEYNPGGFAIAIDQPGAYTVRVLDQAFDLEIADGGLWVQFEPSAG
jgi:hypothetical protein